jgi:hypothetical protein
MSLGGSRSNFEDLGGACGTRLANTGGGLAESSAATFESSALGGLESSWKKFAGARASAAWTKAPEDILSLTYACAIIILELSGRSRVLAAVR